MQRERPNDPVLVIVTPIFNEAEILRTYAAEVRRTLLAHSDIDGRVLFVDDPNAMDRAHGHHDPLLRTSFRDDWRLVRISLSHLRRYEESTAILRFRASGQCAPSRA